MPMEQQPKMQQVQKQRRAADKIFWILTAVVVLVVAFFAIRDYGWMF